MKRWPSPSWPGSYGAFSVKRDFAFFRLFVVPGGRGWDPDRGPLLAFDPLATRDGDGRSLVKAEAAGGGGRRPAFTRVRPSPRIGRRGRWADSPSLAVQHACLSSTSAGEDGFPAVADPIRGVPLSAQTKGLQARIRGSRKRSLPRGQMREARWRGTEGTGPILTAASCSHSPARRPAHLGRRPGARLPE